ncbi:hypothetical protein GME_13120 [Halomonas sp. TD01]|nr:hypothetical protein GME_13120 [Halomonas sp. TD01]
MQGNAAFRRVVDWLSEESEAALGRCFSFNQAVLYSVESTAG